MTCRIIIANFLHSFSIYLVSLSLYTKLIYKVLFKRHLMLVANITPYKSCLQLHSLEALLYLTLQQLGKLAKVSVQDTLRLLRFWDFCPLDPTRALPSAFYTSTKCGKAFGLLFQPLHFQIRFVSSVKCVRIRIHLTNKDQQSKQINYQLMFATKIKPTGHLKLMEQPRYVRNLDARVEDDCILTE